MLFRSGAWFLVANTGGGAYSLTVKDADGNTITTIAQGTVQPVAPKEDGSGWA